MIPIYHPTKNVKGFAFSLWYSLRDDCLFATFIKQSGWDDQNQNGVFKGSIQDPSKKVNVKLSWIEAGGILDCIERNRTFSTYHDNDNGSKSISFSPYKQKQDDVEVQKGFSFTVNSSDKSSGEKNAFYIALSFAEARWLREFIINKMHVSFERFELNRANKYQEEEAKEPKEKVTNNAPATQSKNVLGDF